MKATILASGSSVMMSRKAIGHIAGDEIIFARQLLERLAADEQLRAWRHDGFWRPMDTLRDKVFLEELWESGRAPWKIW